ncbi:tRNA (adenosine(37)-N6)-threonylcarbamoyltransferase complex dimerization subunit type 1 TsaB [Aquisalimonas sp.]|uniref:tRNA (adenosine(37)-N6)-threonylcarbamoyltransferase complex dimerization subunit type 1 TsaB n=1 Tax=Aquisalimonas sp. TaxID=1872621 RepID=UPI0025BE1DFD|nr:tRNA (adenosine(37)-N6)-threonylcarbamoyltransferase complex dimerization subunit type 1 TsaB [Aquisalimonas sp.]
MTKVPDFHTVPILALDTATDACSVALEANDRLAWRCQVTPREHASRLLGLVDEVMGELGLMPANLAAVAWCHGPGSFTGVRIAAGVVQGIAWATRVPVVGESTLAVMAQGAHRRSRARRVWSALDARMGEVYWGAYRLDEVSGLMRPLARDRVCAPGALTVPETWDDAVAVGTGWQVYGEELAARVGPPAALDEVALPDARDLLPFARHRLARRQTVTPRDAVPVYLRDRVTGRA